MFRHMTIHCHPMDQLVITDMDMADQTMVDIADMAEGMAAMEGTLGWGALMVDRVMRYL